MKFKNSIYIKQLVCVVLILFSLIAKAEKDPLHKRVFNVKFSEVKEGGAAKKPIMDKISFKDGKLFSDYLYDKFEYKWLKYRINKDSIYVDSTDTEVRLLEVEAVVTDAANETISINFIVVEWDIDGVIKITKNDKLKKMFEINGREKGGKPKKVKKKDKKKLKDGEDPNAPENQPKESDGAEQKKE
jgi:hypothetical protein